eukprot:scaffold210169_cov20-Prasinocladus_malaysianus.AAC.2
MFKGDRLRYVEGCERAVRHDLMSSAMRTVMQDCRFNMLLLVLEMTFAAFSTRLATSTKYEYAFSTTEVATTSPCSDHEYPLCQHVAFGECSAIPAISGSMVYLRFIVDLCMHGCGQNCHTEKIRVESSDIDDFKRKRSVPWMAIDCTPRARIH